MASYYPTFTKFLGSNLFKKFHHEPTTKVVDHFLSKMGFLQNTPLLHTSSNLQTFGPDSSLQQGDLKPFYKPPAEPTNHLIDNRYLDTFERAPNTEVFIIYLNRPFDLDVLCSLHHISSYTIMADGAANRFHDIYQNRTFKHEFIPHALVGDFDSIRSDVINFYRGKNINIVHDSSQADTDLEKCLRHLQILFLSENLYDENKYFRVLIAGGLGGRLDHMLNNIHVLHKYAERYMKYNVSLHLMDNNSIGTCILPGKTKYIKAKNFEIKTGCGIFPFLTETAHVQTSGLRWDIKKDSSMSFEGFVSSSNELLGEVVEFETDQTVFFTTTNALHGKDREQ